MELYQAMGGGGWSSSENWGTDAPLDDWYGITAGSVTGRIMWIRLAGNNLRGEIPPEIRHSPHLQRLRLDGNRIEGKIPPEIGEPTELRLLWLDDNRQPPGARPLRE